MKIVANFAQVIVGADLCTNFLLNSLERIFWSAAHIFHSGYERAFDLRQDDPAAMIVSIPCVATEPNHIIFLPAN